MKKTIWKTVKMILAGLSLMVFLVAVGPKKAEAQILEGALIGATVGGVVGLFLHFMKPAAGEEPALSVPSGRSDSAASVVAKPVFLPGTEVIERAEPTAN